MLRDAKSGNATLIVRWNELEVGSLLQKSPANIRFCKRALQSDHSKETKNLHSVVVGCSALYLSFSESNTVGLFSENFRTHRKKQLSFCRSKRFCNMLQHAATCCNMLQHAATCCITSQDRSFCRMTWLWCSFAFMQKSPSAKEQKSPA